MVICVVMNIHFYDLRCCDKHHGSSSNPSYELSPLVSVFCHHDITCFDGLAAGKTSDKNDHGLSCVVQVKIWPFSQK